MNEKIIDLDEVMERVQEDKELLLELFEIFTNDYEQKIQKLKFEINKKNFENIKEIVHSIKGAAGNISAHAIHALCMKMEEAAQGNDIVAVEHSVPLLDGQFEHLKVKMSEIKKKFNG